MQRILSTLLVLVVLLTLSACSNATSAPTQSAAPAATQSAPTSEPTEAPPETSAPAETATAAPIPSPEATSDLTVDSIITEMGKTLKLTDVGPKAAEMIGAVEGKGFFVGDKSFEIYKFDNADKIEEAKKGTMKLFGDLTRSCTLNGSFVMIYETPDDDVIAAFQAVK